MVVVALLLLPSAPRLGAAAEEDDIPSSDNHISSFNILISALLILVHSTFRFLFY